MFSRLKQNFVLFFLILLIVFSFGFWFGKSSVICPVLPPDGVDFSLFWEAWKKVEEKYEDKEKLDVEEMIYGAISGMIETLDDPYTVFFKPEEAKKFLEDVKGVFEGVGVEVAIKEEQLQVVAPLEGTPAHKAGLRPGDKIMKVDGKSTANITADTAVDWIRGPKDTEVVLTIYREEWGEERDIEIIRGTIDIPSLKLEIREDDIAYLKLYHFSEEAAYDFREAAINILGSSAKKIILDLRNNPGGYLPVAQNIAGWFLEKGQVVAIEDFGEGKEKKELVAEGNARLFTYPIIVLINQGSASGSEILAGALRDNWGVMLLGETSFGKGSVQELTELRGGFSLKITIAKWLTPKGYSIADKGLEPDIMVELTQDDYDQGRDPQLDRAIEIIRTLE
jgi:carboxyl-terminal processing protease